MGTYGLVELELREVEKEVSDLKSKLEIYEKYFYSLQEQLQGDVVWKKANSTSMDNFEDWWESVFEL